MSKVTYSCTHLHQFGDRWLHDVEPLVLLLLLFLAASESSPPAQEDPPRPLSAVVRVDPEALEVQPARREDGGRGLAVLLLLLLLPLPLLLLLLVLVVHQIELSSVVAKGVLEAPLPEAVLSVLVLLLLPPRGGGGRFYI